LLLSIGGYFIYGALDTALERFQTGFAKKVSALLKSPPEKRPMTFIGYRGLNETTVIPANSYAILSSGSVSPEDRRALDQLTAEDDEALRRLGSEPDKLTVYDLFFADFRSPENTSVRHGGFTMRNGNTGSLTHISYAVIHQLQAGVKILAFHIPYTDETSRIAVSLAGMYKNPLGDYWEIQSRSVPRTSFCPIEFLFTMRLTYLQNRLLRLRKHGKNRALS
jgi:hypothetical protein